MGRKPVEIKVLGSGALGRRRRKVRIVRSKRSGVSRRPCPKRPSRPSSSSGRPSGFRDPLVQQHVAGPRIEALHAPSAASAVRLAIPPILTTERASPGNTEYGLVECGHQRRPLAAQRQVPAPKVGHGRNPRGLHDLVRVSDLQSKRLRCPGPVADRLAMTADGPDILAPGCAASIS